MTDLELLRQFVDQNAHEAFEQLVRRHVGWVNTMALRLTNDPGMSEDVTQAVFVLLSHKARSLKRQMLLSNWLFTVTRYCAKNAIRNEIRRRRHERQAAAMREEAIATTDLPAWEELAPLLDEAVSGLGRIDREALLLRFYQQRSFGEIGIALRISEDAARKRVARAIEQLRGLFARKGLTLGGAALAGVLSANLVPSASATLLASALAGGSTTLAPAMKGIGLMMTLASLKPVAIVVSAMILISAMTVVLVQTNGSKPTRAAAPATAPATLPVAVALPPRGQMVLVGKVVAPAGKSAAGAKAFLVTSEPASGYHTRATDTADSDGRFRLAYAGNDVQPTAVRSIVVQADGFGLSWVRLRTDVAPDEVTEVPLRAAANLHLRFVGADQKPIVGVKITVRTIREKRPLNAAALSMELAESIAQITDANGQCTLTAMPRDGAINLLILDERYAQLGTRERAIELDDAQETNGPTLALQPACEISGRVVVADTGKPAEGVRVTAQATSRARDPGMGDQDFTDAQGNYRLKQLAALEYNVEALLSGDLAGQYTVAALENVSLAPAQKRTGSDLKLVTGSWIVGRVTVQGSDQPVPNVNISVYGPASPQSSALVRGVRTGADGTYKMRVPPGAQYVYYNSPNPPGLNRAAGVEYKRDISVEEGGTVTVNFELAKIPAPELKGVVVDEQGNPVAGANVVMDPRNASPRNDGIAQVTTDDEGKFSIPGVRNGARLSVSKGSLALERPITVSTNRDLKVVIRAIDPATRAPASALVRVQQEDHTPIAGAKARLIVINGSTGLGGETLTTGPEGTVEFKSLSPNGEYAVDFAADGFGRGQIQKLKLEAGKQTETVITLPKADSFIAGIVVDENNIPLPDVEVVSSGGAYGRPQSARSDVAGHFRMNSIVAGDTPSLYVHKGIVNTQPQPVAAGTDNAIVVAKPAAPSTRPSGRAR